MDVLGRSSPNLSDAEFRVIYRRSDFAEILDDFMRALIDDNLSESTVKKYGAALATGMFNDTVGSRFRHFAVANGYLEE